jgi:hypothetical protein
MRGNMDERRPYRQTELLYATKRSPNGGDIQGDRVLIVAQRVREKLRLAVIPNTLELAELWVSPALLDEAAKNPILRIEGGPPRCRSTRRATSCRNSFFRTRFADGVN